MLPAIPTAIEQGVAVEADTWIAVFLPRGASADVVNKLNAAINTTLAIPQLRDRFLTYGVEAMASTPAELTTIIAAEIPAWRRVIEERHVKAE